MLSWVAFLTFRRIENGHWDWRFKRVDRTNQTHRLFAIAQNRRVQGLMAIRNALDRSRSQGGQPLLYVDYIETAPWNRMRLPGYRKYGAVGTLLMREAALASLAIGYEGRVGLHSLPKAKEFYERIGMTDRGIDANPQPGYESLCFLEYTEDAAGEFLRRAQS